MRNFEKAKTPEPIKGIGIPEFSVYSKGVENSEIKLL